MSLLILYTFQFMAPQHVLHNLPNFAFNHNYDTTSSVCNRKLKQFFPVKLITY